MKNKIKIHFALKKKIHRKKNNHKKIIKRKKKEVKKMERQTQAKIFQDFNVLVYTFLVEAKSCFDELTCLDAELGWLQETIERGPFAVYEELKMNLSKISEPIHRKETKTILNCTDSPLLNHLCINQIFPLLLDQEEEDAFWQRLQEIVKKMGLIASVSSCLPGIVNLLKSVHDKNPDINVKDPANSKALLMEQMMNDGSFGEQIKNIFTNTDPETSIFSNLPDKLRMLGLTVDGNGDENESDEKEVEAKVEEVEDGEEVNGVEKVEQTKNSEAPSVGQQAPSAGDMLQKTLKARRKHKNKKGFNIFKKMAEVMDEKKMDAPNFGAELGASMGGMFDGTSPESAEFMSFMKDLAAGKKPDFMNGVDMTAGGGGIQDLLASFTKK